MEFTEFIRKPFKVRAVEITEENMEEVAKLIGTVRTKGDLTFIAIDKRLVPNVNRAYPGWWLTILGENYRCYAPKVFNEQFMELIQFQGLDAEGVEALFESEEELQAFIEPIPEPIAKQIEAELNKDDAARYDVV